MKNTYNSFLDRMYQDMHLKLLAGFFEETLQDAFNTDLNGNLPRWLDAYNTLPVITPDGIDLRKSAISAEGEISDSTRTELRNSLEKLHPWRKGPYELFGTYINTEWRSDWKWDRIAQHIDWHGKKILDIGCGNGYHIFRMAGEGASMVTGIDTSLLSIMQFKSLQKYFTVDNAEIFPVGIQNVPAIEAFDTVLSMGVLYHRKDPIEHLKKVLSLLLPGGSTVIETIIVEGDIDTFLQPEKRYAMMKNVYKIPSVPLLESWLEESGFINIRTVDVSVTTTEEQRSTKWMRFHSLPEFLDPNDSTKTVEGYPAPRRAVIIADKPLIS